LCLGFSMLLNVVARLTNFGPNDGGARHRNTAAARGSAAAAGLARGGQRQACDGVDGRPSPLRARSGTFASLLATQ
jgi:hypothetical protein